MSRKSFGLSVKSNAADSPNIMPAHGISDVINTVSTGAVAAAIAPLVADGASPTEGHVSTLATAWTALLAGTGPVPTTADAILSIDEVAIGNSSTLRACIRALQLAAEGSTAVITR